MGHLLGIVLVNNTLDMLNKQVEEMNGVTSPIDPVIASTNVTLPNELLSTTSLRKRRWKLKPPSAKKLGLTRRASVQKGEVTKKKQYKGV
jgi:hypothetical protein